MKTHSITQVYATNAGTQASITTTLSDNGELGFDDNVPAATVNEPVEIAFAHGQLQSCLLYSTQAITILTNSTSSPGNTITIAAGQAIIWANGLSGSNPFTVDVTKLFISNAGGQAAAVKLVFLVHIDT